MSASWLPQKTALGVIVEHLAGEAQDALRGLTKLSVAGRGERPGVVGQQRGVVSRHLLEVRHPPVAVDAVAVEPAGQVVVNPTAGHREQCLGRCVQERGVVVPLAENQAQIGSRRVRELRAVARAEPAELGVELTDDAPGQLAHRVIVHRSRLGHGLAQSVAELVSQLLPGLLEFLAPLAIDLVELVEQVRHAEADAEPAVRKPAAGMSP